MIRNKLILDKNIILEKLGDEYKELTNIISDKFGIINAILERKELSKYDLYMYQCLSTNIKTLFNSDREVSSGGLGISEDEKGAIISCIAEALERYSMSYIKEEDLIFKRKKDLEKDKTFDDFSLYNEKQYLKIKEFLNPNKDCIHWTKIYTLDNKNWKWWPASLIYLPFSLSKPVAENTSTGTAAGKNIDEAIKSGLLELIERDALMLNFLQELNPLEIDIETIKGKNKVFIDKIKKDYDIKIYKLYSDINIPIYYSLIYKKWRGKIHYGIGASASLNSDYAINKSLKECLFTYFYSKHIMDLRKDNKNEINSLYEHFLYYQGDNFNKLITKSKVIKYKKEKILFRNLIKEIKTKGIEIYYKELTTSDIESTNIKVVKVIAPGLIDLNKSYNLRRLGAKRFFTVPKEFGFEVKKDLSEKPHPFP